MSTAAIVFTLMGAALCIMGIRSLLQRGAPFMTAYWTATPAERTALRTRANYHLVGFTCLGIGLGCFAFALRYALDVPWLQSLAIILLGISLLYAILQGVWLIVNGKL